MLLLKNNKIINVDISEDVTNEVLAIRSFDILSNKDSKYYNSHAVREVVYRLIMHNDSVDYGKYNFRVVKSQYNDNSSLGNYYRVFDTKGEAISRMLEDGFIVTIDGIEITK